MPSVRDRSDKSMGSCVSNVAAILSRSCSSSSSSATSSSSSAGLAAANGNSSSDLNMGKGAMPLLPPTRAAGRKEKGVKELYNGSE